MRFPLVFFLAVSASAAAQTPKPVPAPPPAPARRPAVQTPKPAPAPRPPVDFPDLEQWQTLPAIPSFELIQPDLPPFAWEPFELALPPIDVPDFAWTIAPELPLAPIQPIDLPDFAWTIPPEPLLAPLPPLEPLTHAGPWSVWSGDGAPGGRGALARLRPDQGTAEDSLFRSAREALNRGEYARASTLFQTLQQKFPRSRVAPAALYWRAFSLYRAGSTEDLNAALEALNAQKEQYPDAATDADVATLRTRVYAALANRGVASAETALRAASAAGGTDCDREDAEVRAEALSVLAQLNPAEARPILKKVLARRDECSVVLRRRAVYILGRSGTEESAADLMEVAKSDPEPDVRRDAILLLGRSPGTATVKTLEQLFNESTDEQTRQAALSALRSRGDPESRRVLRAIIERNDVADRMRAEAIMELAGSTTSPRAWGAGTARTPDATRRGEGDEEDAAYLRSLYGKTESNTVKRAIIASVARMGGQANEQWVLGIAKNKEEDISLRREALSRLRTSALSVEELGKLFDALSERDLRYAVVSQLASRDDSAASDKLIEIARSGTDPQVRRMAISALARKKDPRTTKLLLELLEKP